MTTHDPRPSATSTSRQIEQWADELHAAFARHDLDAVAAHWHPDIRYDAPGISLTGIDARRANEQAMLDLLTDTVVTVDRRIIAGRTLIEHDTMTARLIVTDRHFTLHYTQVLDWDDTGLITDQRLAYDTAERARTTRDTP